MLKLVDVHGVPVAFVMDELMVQLRQESDVCEGRKPIMHGPAYLIARLRYHHGLYLAERPHRFHGVIDLVEPVAVGEHILKGEAVTVVLDEL